MQSGIYLGGYEGPADLSNENKNELNPQSKKLPPLSETLNLPKAIQSLLDPITKSNFNLVLDSKNQHATESFVNKYFQDANFYVAANEFQKLKKVLDYIFVFDTSREEDEFWESLQMVALQEFKTVDAAKNFQKKFENLDCKLNQLCRCLNFIFENMHKAVVKNSKNLSLNADELDYLTLYEIFWNVKVITDSRCLPDAEVQTIVAERLFSVEVFQKLHAIREQASKELSELTTDLQIGVARIKTQTKIEESIAQDKTQNYLSYPAYENMHSIEKVKAIFEEYIGGLLDIVKHPSRKHSVMANKVMDKMTVISRKDISDAEKNKLAYSYLMRLKRVMFFTGQLEVKEESQLEQKAEPTAKPETSYFSWVTSSVSSSMTLASSLWQAVKPSMPSSFWRRLNMCLKVYVRQSEIISDLHDSTKNNSESGHAASTMRKNT